MKYTIGSSPMNYFRTVTIVDRGQTVSWTCRMLEVTVPWVCCTCGGVRGEPYGHNFHEDGDWLHCTRWDNPCGHVDKYSQVLAQAQEIDWLLTFN